MLKDKYAIIKLCKFLGCSKSGYYDWVKAGRPEFKAFDEVTNKLHSMGLDFAKED